MKKIIITLAVLPFSLLTGCITVYANMNASGEKTVTMFSGSCSGYGCIDTKEMVCNVEPSGDLSCTDLKPAYKN